MEASDGHAAKFERTATAAVDGVPGDWPRSRHGSETRIGRAHYLQPFTGDRKPGLQAGTEVAGFGGRFGYRVHPHLNLESELNFLPGNSATSGNHLQAFAGVKAGKRWERGGVFLKVRPGFIRFSRDPFGVGKPGAAFLSHQRAASTEPAVDFGGVIEYYTRRGLTLRLDVGYDLIHYALREVRTSPSLPGFEAGGFTTHNWQESFGVGFRF